ncbi:MAG: hypothetical protein V4724_03605 [Pseudomonadota bacterium]
MLGLVFLFSLITTPFLSIGFGIFLFSKLSIAFGVGLTIFIFLILFFGFQYVASMWLINIHAPAKTIEYETTLLSLSSDTSGMTELDVPYVFGLGFFGHVICGIGIIASFLISSKREIAGIVVCGLLATVLIWVLVRNSKASPFFTPPLVASRDGIRSQKYFVPWGDVVDVFVGSDRGRPLYIETTRGASSYQIGGDGRDAPYEAKRVQVPVMGMWVEDAAQYLLIRARLTCANERLKL